MKMLWTGSIENDVIDAHLKIAEGALVASLERAFSFDFDESFAHPTPEDFRSYPEASSATDNARGFLARHYTLLP